MLAKETLKLLKRHDIKLDRRKGQNYLINSKVLDEILEYSKISKNDVVLEIGAGIGTLTIPLAKKADKIIAIEHDQKIADILRQRIKNYNIYNVEVLVADAMKIEFPYFNKVISNLPYKISSPVTFKVLKHNFEYGILMYQLEFAERMAAKPGHPNYSRLSLILHFCAEIKILDRVSKHAFFPNPKVSSAIVKLIPKKPQNLDKFFLKTLKALFQHKRKKTKNALFDSFHEILLEDKKTAKFIISKLDSNLMDKRVMKLEPEDVVTISMELKQIMSSEN
jgi:16S rRNA (adenine1518-N6/adenine1519-N6)-dimethyltransferase